MAHGPTDIDRLLDDAAYSRAAAESIQALATPQPPAHPRPPPRRRRLGQRAGLCRGHGTFGGLGVGMLDMHNGLDQQLADLIVAQLVDDWPSGPLAHDEAEVPQHA
jgi:hypothetical protein